MKLKLREYVKKEETSKYSACLVKFCSGAFFFFKVIPKKNALTTTKNCPGGLLAVTVTAGDSNKLIVAG